ncbi:hypothetical protein IFE13_26700, partial [Enterobacter hormaechei]|nr:hypothetical protein [Enterobacter hormaechei]
VRGKKRAGASAFVRGHQLMQRRVTGNKLKAHIGWRGGEQRIQAIEDSIASYRKNLAQQLALTDKQIAVSRDKVKKLRA